MLTDKVRQAILMRLNGNSEAFVRHARQYGVDDAMKEYRMIDFSPHDILKWTQEKMPETIICFQKGELNDSNDSGLLLAENLVCAFQKAIAIRDQRIKQLEVEIEQRKIRDEYRRRHPMERISELLEDFHETIKQDVGRSR